MRAVLTNRDFFSFNNDGEDLPVRANVGVSCATEEELQFLISYLDGLNLNKLMSQKKLVESHPQYIDAPVSTTEGRIKLKLQSQADVELAKTKEFDAIGSLEIE